MYAIVFYLHSITYAMRAKQVLEKQGIPSKIERSTDHTENRGCGYSLVVHQQHELAGHLLSKAGIPIRRVVEFDRT